MKEHRPSFFKCPSSYRIHLRINQDFTALQNPSVHYEVDWIRSK